MKGFIGDDENSRRRRGATVSIDLRGRPSEVGQMPTASTRLFTRGPSQGNLSGTMSGINLAPGAVLGAKYRLERQLGEGGMGVVWVAVQIDEGKRIALKFIKEAADDADAHRRFLREGRAASAVHHPNVVAIFELFKLDGGSPVIAMELLEGETLRDKIRREHRLTLREFADIIVPVISAVGTAHTLGIVHRDLKPENIFLSRGPSGECVVKVLDFGIAKLTALDGEAARSTGVTTGAVLGTPAYMAPEQVFGERDIDHRADIWALGLIFYQCLAGSLPTEGDNIGQIFKNVVARPFEPLDRLAPGLPAEVSALVARMLSREREFRPADLREVKELLDQHASAHGLDFGPPAGRAVIESAAQQEPVRTLSISFPSHVVMGDADPLGPTAPAAPPQREDRQNRRGALLRMALAGVALSALLGGAAAVRCWRQDDRTVVTPAVLAAPSAVLACPVLRVSGVEEPAGWLGASAAATACERARIILGGSSSRTLIPAELLGLPSEPVDDFPTEPYGSPDARDRSLAAARNRATAYFDGEIVKRASGFSAVLSLHRTDGGEIGRGQGEGRALYEAVRAAMDPLVVQGTIPKASALDPVFGEWSRARDVDAALAFMDVTFSMAQNAGGLSEECKRCDAQGDRLGELGPAVRWLCAYTLGRQVPTPPLFPADQASPATYVTHVRLNYQFTHEEPPEVAPHLHRLFEREPSALGRSLIAATESCLLQSSKPESAHKLALAAVQQDPKNPLGEFCAPWGQFVTIAQNISSLRAMQAWAPWDTTGLYMQALGSGDADRLLVYARRAYTLSPLDTTVANVLADRLLSRKASEEVQTIAVRMAQSTEPVHQLNSDLLQLRIDVSKARFGKALARARRAMEVTPQDAGWVRVLRFEVAWRAIEIAGIIGRSAETADLVVERFIDPDPPPLDGNHISVPTQIPAICARASQPVGRRCFARFHALRERLSGGILPETQAFVQGAERYTAGDFRGAANAWQKLFQQPGLFAQVLPDMMAEAFERAGNVELVDRLEAAAQAGAEEYNGANLAMVRAARRAANRGERASARYPFGIPCPLGGSPRSDVRGGWRPCAREEVEASGRRSSRHSRRQEVRTRSSARSEG